MAQLRAANATDDATNIPAQDWPQLGRDAQRSNYTPTQVNPPYCYIWKWYEAPFASRVQPVVASGRLFIGGMNGVLYARNASTGAALWTFPGDGSPIRHSAGVLSDIVLFSTHLGNTFALDAASGNLRWQRFTGPSATAPLMDAARRWAFVASTNGALTALRLSDGAVMWQHQSNAPILTTPALSRDGSLVFAGNEAIYAFAANADTGALVWQTRLFGQSLADRYPVVLSDTVIYRSQPLYSQWQLLSEGDWVMNQAGPVNADWDADWNAIVPYISNYLAEELHKQTLFVLDATTGVTRSFAPVLHTFGENDPPAAPVVRASAPYTAYVVHRARHGIQTDSPTSVHVATQYDAEIGLLNTSALTQITGLRTADYPQSTFNYEFRLTSDEPAVLTMGGNILMVDSWERLGVISLTDSVSGSLWHIGHVSNLWPECGSGPNSSCGPGGPNPFFPLSGNPADPAYPFPSPRSGEGHVRGGAVIANNMVYWRVLGAGLAGIATRQGDACPLPLVYTQTLPTPPPPTLPPVNSARSLTDYVTLDLNAPVTNPPSDLVQRLRDEVRSLISLTTYPMPYYFHRGFSNPAMWPHNNAVNAPEPPSITYSGSGNAVWHDSGELLLTLAMAYPYLDPVLQLSTTQYVSNVVALYPPWQDMPWDGDWLNNSAPRELYPVPEEIRSNLNNWPPPAASPISLYAVWLWAQRTGDWSLVQNNWAELTQLYDARINDMSYYADFAGAIGYARMTQQLFGSDALTHTQALNAAVSVLQAGQVITPYIDFAKSITQYWAPRDNQPEWGYFRGWNLPVFYGLTPEVGLYLREQTGGRAASLVIESEGPDAMRWWYLTRAGMHGEEGETSYLMPNAAWSHFLAHAYILGDSQQQLRRWLDRPWGAGDLYSIQKIVATIQAAEDATPTLRVWLPIVLRASDGTPPPTPINSPTSCATPPPLRRRARPLHLTPIPSGYTTWTRAAGQRCWIVLASPATPATVNDAWVDRTTAQPTMQ